MAYAINMKFNTKLVLNKSITIKPYLNKVGYNGYTLPLQTSERNSNKMGYFQFKTKIDLIIQCFNYAESERLEVHH